MINIRSLLTYVLVNNWNFMEYIPVYPHCLTNNYE